MTERPDGTIDDRLARLEVRSVFTHDAIDRLANTVDAIERRFASRPSWSVVWLLAFSQAMIAALVAALVAVIVSR